MLSPILIEPIVKAALEEDLGHGFDITSTAVIPPNVNAKASVVARKSGILAGLIVGLSAFSYIDDFEITVHAQDGDSLKAGDIIAEIEGSARSLLTAERTALNFLTHMSGIATLTSKYVQAVKDTKAIICDTRKTLPGLRMLQKYAVICGGGANHRLGLDDAVLIKDNHIEIAGSIKNALSSAQAHKSHMHKISIEVDTLKQLEDVLKQGVADIVLLDNMDIKTLKKAVSMAKGRVITEASGGVNLKTVRDIAQTGVDYISIGALTHSAPALDIGLDILKNY